MTHSVWYPDPEEDLRLVSGSRSFTPRSYTFKPSSLKLSEGPEGKGVAQAWMKGRV